ncbi:hypothetical protein OG242_18700 [Streptomyces sp. NBC_00727]|uniref:hypothetical protein n=1 Tax=Streptomyces sp. NBC_00727 TaxID=2903675 RepID=UPI00386753FA
MSNARDRLDALVAELRENPRVELLNHELTDPLPPDRIGELADGLPAGVEGFYREVGSFKLEWRSAEGDGANRGLADILPLDRVLGDWSGITWFPSGEQEFRPVVPFDFFTPEACTAFERADDGAFADTVSYHYFGEELASTGRTFTEYVELLIASRGYWYWPKTLCRGYEDSAEVTGFRQDMPRLFPDHDDELFRPR